MSHNKGYDNCKVQSLARESFEEGTKIAKSSSSTQPGRSFWRTSSSGNIGMVPIPLLEPKSSLRNFLANSN